METNKSFRDQIELWLILVFLGSLGWSFGLILTSVLVGAIGIAPGSIISLISAGILGGVFVSLLSMYVLRKSVKGIGAWILAATLGWTLGLLGTIYSMQAMSGGIAWIVGGALGGLIYGLIQSFGFKPGFGKSLPWIILNGAGWAVAYGLGYAFPSDMGLEGIASMSVPVAKGMLGWVMLGTFAVLFLILLFATLKRGDRSENRVQWWP
jgi:hypothetical protein